MSEASPSDTVQVDEIYDQKENIQPLSTGRSAKKLHTLFSSDRKVVQNELKETHEQFKREIENSEDLDDPLDVFHRYIRWTISSYPAGASHDSYLVPLLERTTRQFLQDKRYTNDLRYLRIWIMYSKYVDSPNEIFKFLEVNGIGGTQALFYEEWARLEHKSKNFKEADSIYSLGIARKAEPLARLQKNYDAFQQQMMLPQNFDENDDLETSSASAATGTRPIRQVLGASGGTSESSTPLLSSGPSITGGKKANNAKAFKIFSDTDGQSDSKQSSNWDNFGTIASRRAENHQDATSWTDQKITMNTTKKPEGNPKLQVYRDDEADEPSTKPGKVSLPNPLKKSQTSTTSSSKQATSSSRDKKEIYRAPIRELHISKTNEISLEELIARKRGIYPWPDEPEPEHEQEHEPELELEPEPEPEPEPKVKEPENDAENKENPQKVQEQPNQSNHEIKQEKEEIVQASQSSIPRPSLEKADAKQEESAPVMPGSPTMNMKAAMAEVNDMFGKTMKFDKNGNNTSGGGDNGDPAHDDDAFDEEEVDFTTFASKEDVQAQAQAQAQVQDEENERDEEGEEQEDEEEYGEEQDENENENFPQTPGASMNPSRRVGGGGRFANMIDAMTPITERTGDLSTMTRTQTFTDETINFDDMDGSKGLPCNPFETASINMFLLASASSLELTQGFYDNRNTNCNKAKSLLKTFKKTSTSSSSGSLSAHLDIGSKGGFKITKLIGEGGFASVYFGEDLSMIDQESAYLDRAIKIESPTNVWEFLIINEVHKKVNERVKDSIVFPQGLYAFADESYLILDYCRMGTILNAVNKANSIKIAPAVSGATGMDELLCLFFTIELLRTIEELHSAGIIHGDIKADNCMIRLDETQVWTTTYKRDGSSGWSSKGLKLIDFGRSIDVTRFDQNQQFYTNFVADQNDCLEMRQGKPWTYEPDYYGLASVAHVMLFGKFMETSVNDEQEQVIKQTFKRYHQVDLWQPFFNVCLNPRNVNSNGALPITSELTQIRIKMEDWLELNCNKNFKSLKSFLRKLEIAGLE